MLTFTDHLTGVYRGLSKAYILQNYSQGLLKLCALSSTAIRHIVKLISYVYNIFKSIQASLKYVLDY